MNGTQVRTVYRSSIPTLNDAVNSPAGLLSMGCAQDHTVRRMLPCSFASAEALQRGSQLQVRAEWNTSQPVLGADVGFVLWVAER